MSLQPSPHRPMHALRSLKRKGALSGWMGRACRRFVVAGMAAGLLSGLGASSAWAARHGHEAGARSGARMGHVAEQVYVVSQDAQGLRASDLTPEFLDRLEEYTVAQIQQSLPSASPLAQASGRHTGRSRHGRSSAAPRHDPADQHLTSRAALVDTPHGRLIVIRVAGPGAAEQLWIEGLRGKRFVRLACVRTQQGAAIDLRKGLCAQRVREVFSVTRMTDPTREAPSAHAGHTASDPASAPASGGASAASGIPEPQSAPAGSAAPAAVSLPFFSPVPFGQERAPSILRTP